MLTLKQEINIEPAPTDPIPLDVKLEIANFKSQNLTAVEAYEECKRFIQTKKAGAVDSDIAAVWIVEYPTTFVNLYMNWKGDQKT